MRRMTIHGLPLLAALGLLGLGCRGDFSDQPPIHFNPNMDNQVRYDPQEPSTVFADGRAMRRPVPGTVARGQLHADRHLYDGTQGSGFAVGLPRPVPLTKQTLERGQQRFHIYCAPCHGPSGHGDGVIFRAQAGLPRPANYHDQRLRAMPLGEMVHTVTHGKGNMHQMRTIIPAADRWAIVTYVRALQLSQGAPDPDREVTP